MLVALRHHSRPSAIGFGGTVWRSERDRQFEGRSVFGLEGLVQFFGRMGPVKGLAEAGGLLRVCGSRANLPVRIAADRILIPGGTL